MMHPLKNFSPNAHFKRVWSEQCYACHPNQLSVKANTIFFFLEGFMYSMAPLKGITEPVLAFFDSGCSDAARQGVPGKQLPGICVNEGPKSCFGVGATEIPAKQEWIVKLKRKNWNYQLVQILTMGTVCAPMPVVNTGRAVSELKESDQDNIALQNCCVPPQVGGNVDIILGIRYNNVALKAIHNLETGLTIYSINLETHDPSYNAAIGGPHGSFSAILKLQWWSD